MPAFAVPDLVVVDFFVAVVVAGLEDEVLFADEEELDAAGVALLEDSAVALEAPSLFAPDSSAGVSLLAVEVAAPSSVDSGAADADAAGFSFSDVFGSLLELLHPTVKTATVQRAASVSEIVF